MLTVQEAKAPNTTTEPQLDDDHDSRAIFAEANTNRLTGLEPLIPHGPPTQDVESCGDVKFL